MRTFKVPYSKDFISIQVPEANLKGVLESGSAEYKATAPEEALVEQALDNPIGSVKLEDLVKGKKNMVIITSDHTRPVPSKITMPILLRRIREVNPAIDITILVATGFHRPTTKEEMIDKFGPDIVAHEKIVNHISGDPIHSLPCQFHGRSPSCRNIRQIHLTRQCHITVNIRKPARKYMIIIFS